MKRLEQVIERIEIGLANRAVTSAIDDQDAPPGGLRGANPLAGHRIPCDVWKSFSCSHFVRVHFISVKLSGSLHGLDAIRSVFLRKQSYASNQ